MCVCVCVYWFIHHCFLTANWSKATTAASVQATGGGERRLGNPQCFNGQHGKKKRCPLVSMFCG